MPQIDPPIFPTVFAWDAQALNLRNKRSAEKIRRDAAWLRSGLPYSPNPCHFEAKREICFSLPPADSRFLGAALLGMTRSRASSQIKKPWLPSQGGGVTKDV